MKSNQWRASSRDRDRLRRHRTGSNAPSDARPHPRDEAALPAVSPLQEFYPPLPAPNVLYELEAVFQGASSCTRRTRLLIPPRSSSTAPLSRLRMPPMKLSFTPSPPLDNSVAILNRFPSTCLRVSL
ncbi:hypothetical protein M413DRAFT_133798 [Hebeloma cylindrosporum]|uniref:Uncharacterized protein n=1 Tax=Hebeloma cylindrosporum TaxID=76867 RepID=A0A0C2XXN2_HEBCY|nr:hypothetical protein M413DRAFT_133798 [Hebeloma cylindrosporum h7]